MNLYCKENRAAMETDHHPKLKYSPLIILMTSSMTFRNLKSLSVIACNNRLTNLMDYSTAKSLQQCEDISLYDCYGMTEIIGHEDETVKLDQSDDHDHDDELVFSQLYAIRLHGMNNLKSFYNEKYTMSFSRLNMLMSSACKNMKSFCGGTAATTVKTPMLDKILFALKQYSKSYWYSYPLDEAYQQRLKSGEHEYQLLEGDVNATFLKFWEDHHHRS
ncbi:hypothetical protein FEM48_Zijuj02G0044000 [Ziziphus jujuba var. spinosa]|uniref:Disease resistance protein At4g27190-like leucine-rich repeats domain-containing protein n=1 Tax=Ziziphus jujuba var. spinosa TaxID=714518 RepID=A0A978VTL7_ZIZJJ|nr:hypothetical protein FEM48_Zijuj02G0044000 [Ziziphus jujuba var. spinosa]